MTSAGHFVKHFSSCLLAPFMHLWAFGARQITDIRTNPKLVRLAVKSGLAASLAAVICVLEDPFPELTEIGIWAVVTVDLVFESTVGLSLSKGVNRTAGTLLAALIALGVNHVTPHLGSLKPLFLTILVFLGSVIPTYYRYRPPFKDTWSYSFLMMSLTFHILILSGYRHEEKIYYPLARLVMIVLGFMSVGLVHVFILPSYSGDLLHNLVISKLKSVAAELNRCGDGCVFEDISTDNVKEACDSVFFCQAEVDKHLSAIPFEPAHGNFFRGYPWKSYGRLLYSLQNIAHTVITMGSGLHATLQGNTSPRQDVNEEMRGVLHECARIVEKLAASLESFSWEGRPSLAHLQASNDLVKEKARLYLQSFLQTESTAELDSPAVSPSSFSDLSNMSPDKWIPNGKLMDSLLSPRYDVRMEYLQENAHENSLYQTPSASAMEVASASVPLLQVVLSVIEVLPRLVHLIDAVENMARSGRFRQVQSTGTVAFEI